MRTRWTEYTGTAAQHFYLETEARSRWLPTGFVLLKLLDDSDEWQLWHFDPNPNNNGHGTPFRMISRVPDLGSGQAIAHQLSKGAEKQ